MKDIFNGLMVCIILFIVVDFIYTTKNTCTIIKNHNETTENCGILKKNLDYNIYFFNRYW